MITLSIKVLNHIVNGRLVAIPDDNAMINMINIDSRHIESGALFVALVGENFDGHDFVTHAIKAGALAVLVNHEVDNGLPQIIVSDTHQALGQIAAWMRTQSHAKIVAITGSSGKTSVKEMVAAILMQCGKTLYTQGNFNNDIGVPLTLFRLTEQDEFAVIELGANHMQEIAYTTKIVRPQSALINNIAEAHLDGFGSLAGVAQAKGEIFLGLAENGTAIINLDSYSTAWLNLLENKKIYTFSLSDTCADFYAMDVKQGQTVTEFILHTPFAEIRIELPLIGLHNVTNAIAASALAMSVGANLNAIKQGLQTTKSVKGRLYPIQLNDNQLIFDDTYNANSGSMKAAIEVLSRQKGYRVLVVGDMAELGKDSEKCHKQIGKEAKMANLDCVVSVGTDSALISQFSGVGHHFSSKHAATKFLRNLLKEKQKIALLVKGSRSSKMEEIVDNLRDGQD